MIKYIIVLIVSLGSIVSSVAQLKYKTELNSSPFESTIKHGVLANGFTYYIKSVDKPIPKLYLNFYVKVGINQENEDQLNFAHAIEHLAFKNTIHFPLGLRNSIKTKNIAMFDFSATSGKVTNYYFKVPEGNVEILNTALVWFKDIAKGMKLTEADIDQVRGELREEFLLRVGNNLNEYYANSNVEAYLFPGRNLKTHFLKHHKDFNSDKLRQFYNEWYRPDLMAVSIVGNIDDMDAIEEMIQRKFSNIPVPKKNRVETNLVATYYNRPPQFIVTERKIDNTNPLKNRDVEFQLYYRDDSILDELDSMEGIQRLMKLQLLITIINKRFEELTNQYNSFSAICIDGFKYSDLPPALEIKINTEFDEKQAIKKTMRVLHQLQKYGLLKEEWDEIKKIQLRNININEVTSAKYWIQEIFDHFKYNEALPSNKQQILGEWLSGLTMDKFNKYISLFLSDTPKDIGIIAPTGHKAISLKEEKIRSWMQDMYNNAVEPYSPSKTPIKILTPRKNASLDAKKYQSMWIEKLSAYELLFDNGVKVILKPYKSSQNRIEIHGFSSYGAMNFPHKLQPSVLNAANIVRNTGVGKMDKFTLKQIVSNTSIQLSPYIGYHETGIYGQAVFADFEKILQLSYLYFTAPRKNKTAYKDWKFTEKIAYINPTYVLKEADFINSINRITGYNHLSSGPVGFTRAQMGTERFESTKLTKMETAYRSYKNLFGRAKDFTFIISGNFNIDSMVPLIQKYLGNLPNTSGSSEKMHNEIIPSSIIKAPTYNNIVPPKYYTMKNVNYANKFISNVENPFDWKEQLKVKILGNIAGKMGWNLRFRKGYKLYLITANGKYNMEMQRYEVGFNLSCSVADLQLLRQECNGIISNIKSGAISEDVFKSSLREMTLKDGVKVQDKLYNHYRYGQPWITASEVNQFLRTLTKEDIMKTANKYCKGDNLYEFVMKNE